MREFVKDEWRRGDLCVKISLMMIAGSLFGEFLLLLFVFVMILIHA